jgi:nitrogen-specific signal transduction histidine kinase
MASAHPRRVLWLLAAATAIPLAVLGWIGLRTLDQDRQLDDARQQEALRLAAGQLALDLARQLEEVEDRLSRGEGIRLRPDGPQGEGDTPLLYRRAGNQAALWFPPPLPEAEAAEYRARDLRAAAAAYRRAAQAEDVAVRAAALLGLGRVLRQRGDRPGALEAYERLASLGDVTVAGAPAALVARHARAQLLERAGDSEALAVEAASLGRLLAAGHHDIDRATYEEYRDAARRWGSTVPSPEAEARTEAMLRLWQNWRAGDLPPRGRAWLSSSTGPLLGVWVAGADGPVVSVTDATELTRRWRPLADARSLSLALHGPDGEPIPNGGFDTAAGSVSLEPRETRLPFAITVASSGPIAAGEGSTARALIVAVLVLATVVTLSAAYGLYRTTTREAALARQQRDFVSAVSHEFRTPLTSMRHLTDLLSTRNVTSDERRAHYYQLLAHETDRLHRMVEGLLSVGRIEAGAYAWHLEPLDLPRLVTSVIEDFRHDAAALGHDVTLEIDDALPAVAADAEALTRALWNLLDNAAKYSSKGTPVRVSVRRADQQVLVDVADHGIGIARADRDRIFQKFVRGAEAGRTAARGLGIGLALVKQIVEAHGGTVRVASEPGQGSTFTLALPAAPARVEA